MLSFKKYLAEKKGSSYETKKDKVNISDIKSFVFVKFFFSLIVTLVSVQVLDNFLKYSRRDWMYSPIRGFLFDIGFKFLR